MSGLFGAARQVAEQFARPWRERRQREELGEVVRRPDQLEDDLEWVVTDVHAGQRVVVKEVPDGVGLRSYSGEPVAEGLHPLDECLDIAETAERLRRVAGGLDAANDV